MIGVLLVSINRVFTLTIVLAPQFSIHHEMSKGHLLLMRNDLQDLWIFQSGQCEIMNEKKMGEQPGMDALGAINKVVTSFTDLNCNTAFWKEMVKVDIKNFLIL